MSSTPILRPCLHARSSICPRTASTSSAPTWRRLRAVERSGLPEVDPIELIRSRLPLVGPFEASSEWLLQQRRERRREWLDNLFWFVMLATALLQAPVGGEGLLLGLAAAAWLGTLLSLERDKRLAHVVLLGTLLRGHLRAREDGVLSLAMPGLTRQPLPGACWLITTPHPRLVSRHFGGGSTRSWPGSDASSRPATCARTWCGPMVRDGCS